MATEAEAKAFEWLLGNVYQWEPALPHASCFIRVTGVRWNGEEWWVTTIDEATGEVYYNSIERFFEAIAYPKRGSRTYVELAYLAHLYTDADERSEALAAFGAFAADPSLADRDMVHMQSPEFESVPVQSDYARAFVAATGEFMEAAE